MHVAKKWAAAASIAAAIATSPAGAAPYIGASPSIPTYGQSVQIDIGGTAWPMYLPATRFSRTGNTITVEYEYLTDGFGPTRPDFGYLSVTIGELPAGNYTMQARLFDINQPKASPQTISASLAVPPPAAWGLYMVPAHPQAFQPAEVMVRSAAYFDPASLRATVLANNTVRVDFDYDGSAPVVSAASGPPGMSSFASVKIPGLAPGTYRIEGWGRDRKASYPERYFIVQADIASTVQIVEYYAESLDHYFMSAWPDEVAGLDAAQQGFKRTGQTFKAWLRESDSPYNVTPICRFYARGPNSHFYTGDAAECQGLKALEQKQRAEAAARGQPFLGWQYEAVAFYALMPHAGKCPDGTQPVYREYNMRAQQNDSNHRFVVNSQLRAAMMMGWTEEGVAFCSLM